MAGFTKSEINAARRDENRDRIARAYIGKDCTIDGRRARIYRSGDFARVCIVNSGLSCEYAWETIENVMVNKQGKFKS